MLYIVLKDYLKGLPGSPVAKTALTAEGLIPGKELRSCMP